MRLYRVAGATPSDRVCYAGTMADAKAKRLELTGATALRRGEAQEAITEIDVPTDKAGLLAYLNALASGTYPD